MSENITLDDLKYAQGPATIILPGSDEAQKDADGVTKPNLHRRIDQDLSELQPDQVSPDTYSLLVAGTDSYRNIKHYYHDEDSTTSEIP